MTVETKNAVSIAIAKASLVKTLTHLARSVERRNTIPILSHMRVEAGAHGLCLTATDLDIEMRATIEASVEGEGRIAIPAHTLSDIVKKMPDGSQVSLQWDGDGKATLRTGRSRFTLQTMDAADFPDLSGPKGTPCEFEMPASALVRLLEGTAFAMSTEETRYYLNGVYLHHLDSKLRAVATDGHRLALIDIAAPEGAETIAGVIIPAKTVQETIKMAKDSGDATATLKVTKDKIQITIGATTLTSKLIDGTFPDYQRVIPARNERRATLDRKALSGAVERVAAISSERGRAVKMSFANDQLTLSVSNPDAGSASEEINAEYGAEPIDIGFNARYVADILGAFAADTLTIDLDNHGAPALIRIPDDSSRLAVLMPMRV